MELEELFTIDSTFGNEAIKSHDPRFHKSCKYIPLSLVYNLDSENIQVREIIEERIRKSGQNDIF